MTHGQSRVAVIGTGYVGLTAAACLAHLGHDVTGIDIDTDKVAALRQGHVTIVEAGLAQLVVAGLDAGLLRFESSYAHAVDADVVLLCLPTPTTAAGDLDLTYVEAAAVELRQVLRSGTIVTTKSTVPVGTHRDLTRWLDRDDLIVAANPEFLREGSAVHDFCHPDRVVVGAATPEAAARVAALYESLGAPVLLTDPASAELIKFAANTFLATKLSFVNEMSRVCEVTGADIDAVVAGIGGDHRIGAAFTTPGPGWGGSCFPKDTRGMSAVGRRHDLDLQVVAASIASNEAHKDHIVDTIVTSMSVPPSEATVAVWGATFKAGTDDCRESPALAIVHRLMELGVAVRLYDPAVRPELPGVENTGDLYEACVGADLLVVATEWAEFGEADLDKVAHLLTVPVAFDTRSILDPVAAEDAGLTLRRIGHAHPVTAR